jgi:hypothetical protein
MLVLIHSGPAVNPADDQAALKWRQQQGAVIDCSSFSSTAMTRLGEDW